MKSEKAKTGILALDKITNGGIPRGSLVLLSGAPGTGKTVLGFEFVYNGAKKYNESGLYFSLDEDPNDVILDMTSLGFKDIEELIKSNRLEIIKVPMFDFFGVKKAIKDAVEKIGAKRIVIDSASIISMFFRDEDSVRRGIMEISEMSRKIDCTTILIDETPHDKNYSRYGVDEFVADTVITLYRKPVQDKFYRAIAVIKMRGSGHSDKVHPMEITPEGIKIFLHKKLPADFKV